MLDSVGEVFRNALIRHKSKRPEISNRTIEKHSGVNRKLLSDLERGHSLDKFQILQFFDLFNYLKRYKDLTEVEVKQLLANLFGSEKEFTPMANLKIPTSVNLHDRITFTILCLASFHDGISEEDITNILGSASTDTLNDLLETGIIERENATVFLKGKCKNLLVPVELVKHHQNSFLNYVSQKRHSLNHSHIFFEKLNITAINKIIELYAHTYNELDQIWSDPNSLGDIPFFAFASADVFKKENIKE